MALDAVTVPFESPYTRTHDVMASVSPQQDGLHLAMHMHLEWEKDDPALPWLGGREPIMANHHGPAKPLRLYDRTHPSLAGPPAHRVRRAWHGNSSEAMDKNRCQHAPSVVASMSTRQI